jgi:hypothetical protein
VPCDTARANVLPPCRATRHGTRERLTTVPCRAVRPVSSAGAPEEATAWHYRTRCWRWQRTLTCVRPHAVRHPNQSSPSVRCSGRCLWLRRPTPQLCQSAINVWTRKVKRTGAVGSSLLPSEPAANRTWFSGSRTQHPSCSSYKSKGKLSRTI